MIMVSQVSLAIPHLHPFDAVPLECLENVPVFGALRLYVLPPLSIWFLSLESTSTNLLLLRNADFFGRHRPNISRAPVLPSVRFRVLRTPLKMFPSFSAFCPRPVSRHSLEEVRLSKLFIMSAKILTLFCCFLTSPLMFLCPPCNGGDRLHRHPILML